MKQRFFAFGLGLLVVAAVIGLVILGRYSTAITFVLNDARLFYALGAILLLGGALWLGARGNSSLGSAILLWLPLGGATSLPLQKTELPDKTPRNSSPR